MKNIDNKNLFLRSGSASGELLQPRGNSCGVYGNNCGWAQKIGSCYKCLVRILKILSEMSRKDISSDGQESYCRGLVKSMAEIKSTQNKIYQSSTFTSMWKNEVLQLYPDDIRSWVWLWWLLFVQSWDSNLVAKKKQVCSVKRSSMITIIHPSIQVISNWEIIICILFQSEKKEVSA